MLKENENLKKLSKEHLNNAKFYENKTKLINNYSKNGLNGHTNNYDYSEMEKTLENTKTECKDEINNAINNLENHLYDIN